MSDEKLVAPCDGGSVLCNDCPAIYPEKSCGALESSGWVIDEGGRRLIRKLVLFWGKQNVLDYTASIVEGTISKGISAFLADAKESA